jgi:hypothetical protein
LRHFKNRHLPGNGESTPTRGRDGFRIPLFWAKAIQGTFVYHKIEKAENPYYKPARKWMYFVGIPVGALFLLSAVIGYLSTANILPSPRVLTGTEIGRSFQNQLLSNGVVSEDEYIDYFYSEGLFSIMEGGTVPARFSRCRRSPRAAKKATTTA